MLSSEAQQSLPHDAQVALQQVDNCELDIVAIRLPFLRTLYEVRFLLESAH